MVTNKTSKFLISCFSAFFVFQSLTLSAGESIVGYVIKAQGPIEKQYSAGMAISNKTKIDVSGDSKLTVFHNKKCETIEIKGTTITFRLASYKPRISTSIRRLNVGCAAAYHPKGSSSGLTLRSSKKNKSRLNPTFLIHQINQVDKTVKYEKLTLKPHMDKNPPPYNTAKEVELTIDNNSHVINWPKDKPLLKPDTEYKIYLLQGDKVHEFENSIRTTSFENKDEFLKIIILKP